MLCITRPAQVNIMSELGYLFAFDVLLKKTCLLCCYLQRFNSRLLTRLTPNDPSKFKVWNEHSLSSLGGIFLYLKDTLIYSLLSDAVCFDINYYWVI